LALFAALARAASLCPLAAFGCEEIGAADASGTSPEGWGLKKEEEVSERERK
jgi:hypothetical protein